MWACAYTHTTHTHYTHTHTQCLNVQIALIIIIKMRLTGILDMSRIALISYNNTIIITKTGSAILVVH